MVHRRRNGPGARAGAPWWERAVAAFPNDAEYAARTEREIPLFVLDPR